MSKKDVGRVSTNGRNKIQPVDVKKVLGSAHKMSKGNQRRSPGRQTERTEYGDRPVNEDHLREQLSRRAHVGTGEGEEGSGGVGEGVAGQRVRDLGRRD